MSSPQGSQGDLKKMITDTKQDMEDMHSALEKLRRLSQEEQSDSGVLRSRIEEQSSLICLLKQRADQMLVRCQALERINAELESLRQEVQKELENERRRSTLLEERFFLLDTNHRELINFKDEYKRQNAKLTEENRRLQQEKESLFCQEVQEKEEIILKLTQELKDLAEQHKRLELEYQEKTSGFQIKLKELMTLHRTKEASLQDELHSTQKQLQDAVEKYNELDLQLRQSLEKEKAETRLQERIEVLTKENEQLQEHSTYKEKIIQDKEREIQLLESQKQEQEASQIAAEQRFEKEAAVVNADMKVKELHKSLEESVQKSVDLKKEFEAYKKYSRELLAKERELNVKLRQLIG